MTAETMTTMTLPGKATIHPGWVRASHWINAFAILVMIGSGWQIYNASPLFDFTFPERSRSAVGSAGALDWHFAAMWVLVINGLVYVTLGLVTGRFRRKLLPIRPADFVADVKAAPKFKLAMTIFRTTTRFRSCSMPALSSPASSSCCPGCRSGSRCSSRISPPFRRL